MKRDAKKKWEEYAPVKETRDILYDLRQARNMSKAQTALAISEETGYYFTEDMYRAIEQGMTKQVPLWVILAFMKVYDVLPDDMFPSIGRMF